jgi:hypothetical protein
MANYYCVLFQATMHLSIRIIIYVSHLEELFRQAVVNAVKKFNKSTIDFQLYVFHFPGISRRKVAFSITYYFPSPREMFYFTSITN